MDVGAECGEKCGRVSVGRNTIAKLQDFGQIPFCQEIQIRYAKELMFKSHDINHGYFKKMKRNFAPGKMERIRKRKLRYGVGEDSNLYI